MGLHGAGRLPLRGGVAETEPQELDDAHTELFYAFLWTFLNAIPTLELPQALGSERPVRFTDHVTPPLLPLYKLTVILQVIATGALMVRRARDRARITNV